MHLLLDQGIDGIFTNCPDVRRARVDERGVHHGLERATRALRNALRAVQLELDTTHRAPDEIAADVMAALNLSTRRS